ncbi:Methyl-CpG-binding domain-containing protein 4 [Morus notabilis]|uniref:Methyl-CpG-binding domain-containing protein 4 n=2 Tax=Morus notabilis TaxID=981085 RepID=W9QKM8_9ROSA|nr:Methyl-CpG-binding domain-containing protein 4 [Morus notabilis]
MDSDPPKKEERIIDSGDSPKTPRRLRGRQQTLESSVDVFAAQCDKCQKWRVISTQEEFEDIRSKISKEPFYCDRKPGVSCEDPADLNFDSTRTWVIDRPDLPKTPEGFKRTLVLRKDYSKMDVYYITPLGKKVRTPNEIAEFLKKYPQYTNFSPDDFRFTTPKIVEETIPPNVLVAKRCNSTASSSKKKIKKLPELDEKVTGTRGDS